MDVSLASLGKMTVSEFVQRFLHFADLNPKAERVEFRAPSKTIRELYESIPGAPDISPKDGDRVGRYQGVFIVCDEGQPGGVFVETPSLADYKDLRREVRNLALASAKQRLLSSRPTELEILDAGRLVDIANAADPDQ